MPVLLKNDRKTKAHHIIRRAKSVCIIVFVSVFCAETLASTRRHPAELRVTGYSYYGVTSVDSRPTGRGMSVYVLQGYTCVRKSCYECSCHEVVCLRIRVKHMKF